MNSESSLHYSVQKILADNVSVRVWLVSTNWDQTLHGFVLARMTRQPMKFARQPPIFSLFLFYFVFFSLEKWKPAFSVNLALHPL